MKFIETPKFTDIITKLLKDGSSQLCAEEYSKKNKISLKLIDKSTLLSITKKIRS